MDSDQKPTLLHTHPAPHILGTCFDLLVITQDFACPLPHFPRTDKTKIKKRPLLRFCNLIQLTRDEESNSISPFNSNATTRSALIFLFSSHASEFSKKIKMSLDKPDGFCFRWTEANRRCILQLEYQLCESLGKLEIHKPTLKKDLTPLDQLATTTTTIPDPPPLGPDPGRGPDFPGPPLPPPPIPNIPLKPPNKPPPKPPDEVPPQTPPHKVPPPDHPPGRRPPMPPDV